MADTQSSVSSSDRIRYPAGFRRRRGLNWFSLGLLYGAYYMCRYNFRFATPGMMEEFSFTKSQIADMLAIWNLAYGTGQLINGLLCDRIGGKRSMLIGAIGTVIINLVFGFASFVGTFATFSLIWLINGYMQAFGAPGMVKINAAWFQRRERGTFAGIFGFMIQLGQVSISKLAPMILAGITFGTMVIAEPGEWRWLFRIPPLITAACAIFMWLAAKQTPEEAGYPGAVPDEIDNSAGVTVSLKESFKTIFTHPLVWFYAAAYGCTGAVRQSSDQLAILYFEEALGFDMKVNIPVAAVLTLTAMPMMAVFGSFVSGWVSDRFFKGHRSPVAMTLYFFEAFVISCAAVILLFGLVGPTSRGIFLGCLILILIALTANSTHSIVGAAAPMDIGGKKMAGFAAGVIDSFQYYGGAISLFITGRVLEATQETYGWTFWYVIMSGFGVLGGIAMLLVMRKQKRLAAASAPAEQKA
ncbi:MAG: MFS transporter [Kiritimatiellae bacterium]|nr:MFS transporter [Kiritimatiellia bacterium]